MDDDFNGRRDLKKEKKIKFGNGERARAERKMDELASPSSCWPGPYVSQSHLFAVIHTGDSDFALGDVVVLVDIVHQSTILWIFRRGLKMIISRISNDRSERNILMYVVSN